MASKPIPKTVRSVYVEKHEGRAFAVVLVNSDGQSIRPGTPTKLLREVLSDAADWADFFGVALTPYRIAGVIIEPVRRHIYSDVKIKTFDELHATYRVPISRELNLNKLMHHEWDRLRSQHADKAALVRWLLPYEIDISVGTHGAQEWLKTSCKGSWMAVKGAVRFSDDTDAALYKLFFVGNRTDDE